MDILTLKAVLITGYSITRYSLTSTSPKNNRPCNQASSSSTIQRHLTYDIPRLRKLFNIPRSGISRTLLSSVEEQPTQILIRYASRDQRHVTISHPRSPSKRSYTQNHGRYFCLFNQKIKRKNKLSEVLALMLSPNRVAVDYSSLILHYTVETPTGWRLGGEAVTPDDRAHRNLGSPGLVYWLSETIRYQPFSVYILGFRSESSLQNNYPSHYCFTRSQKTTSLKFFSRASTTKTKMSEQPKYFYEEKWECCQCPRHTSAGMDVSATPACPLCGHWKADCCATQWVKRRATEKINKHSSSRHHSGGSGGGSSSGTRRP